MNFYALLADILIFFHVLYVAVVVVGQLAIVIAVGLRARWVRNPWLRGIHLTMAVVVAFEAAIEFECPLTTLEYEWRIRAGQMPPNFRELEEYAAQDLSFIGRHLHMLDTAAVPTDTLHYSLMGFGGLVLATLLLVPPRKFAVIVALDLCCLSLLYVCWTYAGQPGYWGSGTWHQGVLVCVWNALPFVMAGGIALWLRERSVGSVFFCGMVMLTCVFGLYELKSARAASASTLSPVELLLPPAHFVFLYGMSLVARRLGKSPVREATPTTLAPAVEGATGGGST